MKVVLVAPYSYNHIGVRQLHSIIEKEGFEVHTIFFKRSFDSIRGPLAFSEKEIGLFREMIEKINPDFVGFSFISSFLELVNRLSEEVRKISKCRIIYGGTHPTIYPESCIKHADAVCVGDGEDAIIEYLKNPERKDIMNMHIGGIRNEIRPLRQDFDDIPFLDFSEKNKYYIEDEKVGHVNEILKRKKEYPMMTSRGCPFLCTYCCNSQLKGIFKGKGPYLRRMSPKRVVDELEYAKNNYEIEKIEFWDNVFTYDEKWIKEFCEMYKQRVNLPFFCLAHAKLATYTILKMLKEAGLENMIIGIEAGSERVRKRYFKRYESNQDILNAAKSLNELGIKAVYDLMVENPFENEEDKRETLNLLMQIPKPFGLIIYSLTFFPNIPLTQIALDEGVINISEKDEKKVLSEHYSRPINLKRKKDLFWNSIFILILINVPNKVVERISRISFLKKYPKLLAVPLNSAIYVRNKIKRVTGI
ncbi:B12-binding domain-containing radical SAM protein [Candidatus Woesearchaeota archaeon]|nr:B12-binding domain-containing radical SAM protein [Candidatus Woesearchaeota archaeon]